MTQGMVRPDTEQKLDMALDDLVQSGDKERPRKRPREGPLGPREALARVPRLVF